MMGPEALGRLIDAHAAALTLYARQWCVAPDDVVQEAFVKLVTQSVPPDQVVPWLYRVVRNGALSALRAQRRRQRHESEAAFQAGPWFTERRPADLDAEAATAALQGLPLEQREVIVAHLWGGLTFEQVAAVAGVSPSTAHRWYAAGLSALRERLGVTCPHPDHSTPS